MSTPVFATAAEISANLAFYGANPPSSIVVTDNAPLALTVADLSVYVSVLNLATNADSTPYKIKIVDTAANVMTALDSLAANTHLYLIDFTDVGTPTLALSASQVTHYASVFSKIAFGDYKIDVTDTAANFATYISPNLMIWLQIQNIVVSDSALVTLDVRQWMAARVAKNADGSDATFVINDSFSNVQTYVGFLTSHAAALSIVLTDPGVPALPLSEGEAIYYANVYMRITSPHAFLIHGSNSSLSSITPANIAVLKTLGVASITSTDTSFVSIATALAFAEQGLVILGKTGEIASVLDTPANLSALTANQLATLNQLGYTDIGLGDTAAHISAALEAYASNPPASLVVTDNNPIALSVAQMTSAAAVLDALHNADGSSYRLLVVDTMANGLNAFDALASNVHVAAIKAFDAARPTLLFTAQQFKANLQLLAGPMPFGYELIVRDTAAALSDIAVKLLSAAFVSTVSPVITDNSAISLSAGQVPTIGALPFVNADGSAFEIAVHDSAANAMSYLAAMMSNGHVASITLSDAATPTLTLSTQNVVAKATFLTKIVGPHVVIVQDTPAALAQLSGADFAALKSAGVSKILLDGLSHSVDIATAAKLLANGFAPLMANGVVAPIADTAANIAAITQEQADALHAAGYRELTSTTGPVAATPELTAMLLANELVVTTLPIKINAGPGVSGLLGSSAPSADGSRFVFYSASAPIVFGSKGPIQNPNATILARRIDGAGAPIGTEISLKLPAPDAGALIVGGPSSAFMADGRFVIAYGQMNVRTGAWSTNIASYASWGGAATHLVSQSGWAHTQLRSDGGVDVITIGVGKNVVINSYATGTLPGASSPAARLSVGSGAKGQIVNADEFFSQSGARIVAWSANSLSVATPSKALASLEIDAPNGVKFQFKASAADVANAKIHTLSASNAIDGPAGTLIFAVVETESLFSAGRWTSVDTVRLYRGTANGSLNLIAELPPSATPAITPGGNLTYTSDFFAEAGVAFLFDGDLAIAVGRSSIATLNSVVTTAIVSPTTGQIIDLGTIPGYVAGAFLSLPGSNVQTLIATMDPFSGLKIESQIFGPSYFSGSGPLPSGSAAFVAAHLDGWAANPPPQIFVTDGQPLDISFAQFNADSAALAVTKYSGGAPAQVILTDYVSAGDAAVLGANPIVLGFKIADSAANILTLDASQLLKASFVVATGENRVSATQAKSLAAIGSFSVDAAASLVVADSAPNLLLPANAVGLSKATAVTLTGVNTLTAADAAKLAALPNFALDPETTLTVLDRAQALLNPANAAGVAIATGLVLSGANAVTAAQLASLAVLPNLTLEPGVALTVVDTAVNLAALAPAASALATMAIATGANHVSAAQMMKLSGLPGFTLARGATLVVADAAANLLAGAGLLGKATSVTLTGANAVTASQATTLAGLKRFAVGAGATLVISDSAENLLGNGYAAGKARATAFQLTGANFGDASQAAALAGLKGYSLAVGATLSVSDAMAKLLNARYATGLAKATSVTLTGAAQATASQAAALARLPGFALGPDAMLSVSDTATNLALAANAAGLAKASSVALVDRIAAIVGAAALGQWFAEGFSIVVTDLGSITEAQADALKAAGATTISTPTAARLSFQQASWLMLDGITVSGAPVTVRGTAAQLLADPAGLAAAGVDILNVVDPAAKNVSISVSEARLLASSQLVLASALPLQISDSASNLSTVTVADIGVLAGSSAKKIVANDAPAALTVAQALALEAANITLVNAAPPPVPGVTMPGGYVQDTGAAAQSLTVGDILGLRKAGLVGLTISSGDAMFDKAQTSALLSQGLLVSPQDGASAQGVFANDDTVKFTKVGVSWEITLAGAAGFTYSAGDSTTVLGQTKYTPAYVSAGAQKMMGPYGGGEPASPAMNDVLIHAEGAAQTDTFVFSHEGFGHAEIFGFVAGAATAHDVLQLKASDFGVSPNAGAVAIALAIAQHSTQNGADITITNNNGDSITLMGVSGNALVPADFKFV